MRRYCPRRTAESSSSGRMSWQVHMRCASLAQCACWRCCSDCLSSYRLLRSCAPQASPAWWWLGCGTSSGSTRCYDSPSRDRRSCLRSLVIRSPLYIYRPDYGFTKRAGPWARPPRDPPADHAADALTRRRTRSRAARGVWIFFPYFELERACSSL